MATFLQRLDARDRALFARWVLEQSAARRDRVLWEMLTHLGSAWCSIALCLLPIVTGAFVSAGTSPLAILVASHVVIQVLKRSFGRVRPEIWQASIAAPDRFSFPSGHAAAAMSVAIGFAHAFPYVAAPLVVLAVLVGLSRVVLGVHYPSDVFVGQTIAMLTAAALSVLGISA